MKGGVLVAPLSHSLSSFVPVIVDSLNCSALFSMTLYGHYLGFDFEFLLENSALLDLYVWL